MKNDKTALIRKMKTARGQMDGLLKMLEEDRYCIDISNQLLATIAILKNINKQILEDHLNSCVFNSLTGKKEDVQDKISEIIAIVDKLSK